MIQNVAYFSVFIGPLPTAKVGFLDHTIKEGGAKGKKLYDICL